MPLQGSRLLRRGRCQRVLRARATRRRDGGAADRRAADGRGGAVRDRETRGASLMGVVGPSGSGKSSALRAGLLAALAAGVLPGSERWALALLRPGEHPVRALEQAVSDAAPRGRLVVAVDQFEELFTACRQESERAA